MKNRSVVVLLLIATLFFTAACGAPATIATAAPTPQNVVDLTTLKIVANSDIETLVKAGIFDDFTRSTGVKLDFTYEVTIDIRNEISAVDFEKPGNVDIYWPDSSLQIPKSPNVTPVPIMKTYIVLPVDPAVADSLDWKLNSQIPVSNLIDAIRAKKISLAMPSSSQTNVGQAFYLASMASLCHKNVLTSDCLQKPEVVDGIKALLAGVERSASSVVFLEDMFIKDKKSGENKWNAMVAYESVAIDMNKKLIAAGQKPMRVFYIEGATAFADEPLVFSGTAVTPKYDLYNKLVAYLQTDVVKAKIQALGWRTNEIGMTLVNADPTVFNPAWGINTTTDFPLMIFPKAKVTAAALSELGLVGKPSASFYCIDNSGSMNDPIGDTGTTGHQQMVDAMDLILDQTRAAKVELLATNQDITKVYAFGSGTQEIGTVLGNNPVELKNLSNQISNTNLGGNTYLFDCLSIALDDAIKNYDPSKAWEIIVMTDGMSNHGMSPEGFISKWQEVQKKTGITIPVYGISFGNADVSQLNYLKATTGDVYDGTTDIALAFRNAKGNNK